MEINIIRYPKEEDWKRALLLARETQGKEGDLTPSLEWKRKLIDSEHSPLRTIMFTIEMKDIPYCNSVHFVRHKFGVEHYVRSQRSNKERGNEPQNAPVNHIMDINAQALIFMARKRLCYKADKTTRDIMIMIRDKVIEKCPEFKDFLQPECIYRGGFCHEFKSCGIYHFMEVESVTTTCS